MIRNDTRSSRPLFRLVMALAATVLLAGSRSSGTKVWPETITPPLREALEKASPTDLIPVSVVLRERLSDHDARQLESLPKGMARRKAAADALRRIAARTQ